ncbi:hypothetical protein ACQ4PT_014456 [Festuca glaucescens]
MANAGCGRNHGIRTPRIPVLSPVRPEGQDRTAAARSPWQREPDTEAVPLEQLLRSVADLDAGRVVGGELRAGQLLGGDVAVDPRLTLLDADMQPLLADLGIHRLIRGAAAQGTAGSTRTKTSEGLKTIKGQSLSPPTNTLRSYVPSHNQNKKEPTAGSSNPRAPNHRKKPRSNHVGKKNQRWDEHASWSEASLPGLHELAGRVEEELLRNVQKEIEEEARARHRAKAGQGSSFSAPPSPSRFWPGVRQAAKKVLGVGQEAAACDTQEVAPFAEMEQAMTGLMDLSNEEWCISQKDNCLPNEVAVKWSLDDDDGIPYPLYAEFCGETISSSERREWTDVKLVRKLRGLRQQERLTSRNHFKLRLTWPGTRRKSSSLFMVAMDKLNNEKQKDKYREGCEVPEYLLCPLSCELMVDPVTIATGKTFERRVLKDWFKKNGHICPVTGELVSSTILRNDRVKGYLEECRSES